MRDYKQYTVLFVDDEAHALKYFLKAFSNSFRILTANSAAEGWKLIEEKASEIGVLMTDQRMPGETGVQLLEKVRLLHPQIIRILVTAYADLDSAIAAVNSGAIYKYISKPWDINDLQISLMRALDYFIVQKERDELLREKMLVVQQILVGSQEKSLAILGMGLTPFMDQAMYAIRRFVKLMPYHLVKTTPKENYWKDLESRTNREVEMLSSAVTSLKKMAFPQNDNKNIMEEPLSLEQILEKLEWPELNDKVTLNIAPNLPRIPISSSKLGKVLAMLGGALHGISDQNFKLTINARSITDDQGKKMVEFMLADNQKEWTQDQWRDFFSPFILNNASGNSGLHLLVCLILITQAKGDIEIKGDADAKITVLIPSKSELEDPPSSAQPPPEEILRRILKHDRQWEYF